jgi:hypothetical protein
MPQLRGHLFRHMAMLLAALFIGSSPLAGVAAASPNEYSLKAAFIFNFAKFVEWPEGAFRRKGEFCIATLGRTPLDRELAALSGKSINGRSIVSPVQHPRRNHSLPGALYQSFGTGQSGEGAGPDQRFAGSEYRRSRGFLPKGGCAGP